MTISIPKNKTRKVAVYVTTSKITMAAIKKAPGCQYILNVRLYNMNAFTPVNMLTVDGEDLFSGGNPYRYAIHGEKVAFSYGNIVNYPALIGTYPVLVQDGIVAGTAGPASLERYRPRSCIGLTADSNLVLACDQSNRSLDGMAGDLVEAGRETAINLDGGGSSQRDFNGEVLTTSRIVHNYLFI